MQEQRHDLRHRVFELEKQNRRLRHLGAAALILPALLIVMGQASPRRQIIEAPTIAANEFILKDPKGRVRAGISMNKGDWPQLSLYDSAGEIRVSLSAPVEDGGLLMMTGAEAHTSLTPKGVTFLWPNHQAALDRDGVYITDDKGRMYLSGGRLKFQDHQGFTATLGTSDLVIAHTGETRTTSAASLVMSDKDGNVIWKTP